MNKLDELFNESGILYKAGVKKYGKEGMKKIMELSIFESEKNAPS